MTAATQAQIDYLRLLGKQVHGDEYWVNDHLQISRSVNLTKKLSKQQASELINALVTARDTEL